MNTELNGLSNIGNAHGAPGGATFQACNPATGEALEPHFHEVHPEEIDRACKLAAEAFPIYRSLSIATRAAFLRTIAAHIESIGDVLSERFTAESGLPRGRADGERARTCGQLRLFADEIEKPDWNHPRIERAQPDRQPLPKPDMRMRYIPIGPVAVFGPANFPLAFSTAGGDTASALAAGCPVIVKAHSSHPGVSELVGRAVLQAARDTGMPEGVFSMLFGSGRTVGKALISHPAVKAAGFTGSETAGRALFNLAAARPEPIPVFAEMSSINPVLILPGALESRHAEIVEGLYASLTVGVGQFCTNPGLILLPQSEAAERFATDLGAKLGAHQAQPMLNRETHRSYLEGIARLGGIAGVEMLVKPADHSPACHALPGLFRTTADTFIREHSLHAEVFGPATLLVSCANPGVMAEVVSALGGQLTATLHATTEELTDNEPLLALLESKAGRIVCNGFPTGVEVCGTMVHGGPYPATTDGRFTSVGTRAIDRFLRPVCYQDYPESILPKEIAG